MGSEEIHRLVSSSTLDQLNLVTPTTFFFYRFELNIHAN